MSRHIGLFAIVASLSAVAAAEATPITVLIDTSALAGTPAQLVFDFIDGGPPSNAVTISGFSTNGALGAFTATGGVTGSLPGTVVLSDSSFFNELATALTLGTTLSFTFNPTTNAGLTPDAFTLFLLDATGTSSLFRTDDPTGADALLVFETTAGPGSLSVFRAPGGEVTVTATSTAVPEPATLILSSVGLITMRMMRRRKPRTPISFE